MKLESSEVRIIANLDEWRCWFLAKRALEDEEDVTGVDSFEVAADDEDLELTLRRRGWYL